MDQNQKDVCLCDLVSINKSSKFSLGLSDNQGLWTSMQQALDLLTHLVKRRMNKIQEIIEEAAGEKLQPMRAGEADPMANGRCTASSTVALGRSAGIERGAAAHIALSWDPVAAAGIHGWRWWIQAKALVHDDCWVINGDTLGGVALKLGGAHRHGLEEAAGAVSGEMRLTKHQWKEEGGQLGPHGRSNWFRCGLSQNRPRKRFHSSIDYECFYL